MLNKVKVGLLGLVLSASFTYAQSAGGGSRLL